MGRFNRIFTANFFPSHPQWQWTAPPPSSAHSHGSVPDPCGARFHDPPPSRRRRWARTPALSGDPAAGSWPGPSNWPHSKRWRCPGSPRRVLRRCSTGTWYKHYLSTWKDEKALNWVNWVWESNWPVDPSWIVEKLSALLQSDEKGFKWFHTSWWSVHCFWDPKSWTCYN